MPFTFQTQKFSKNSSPASSSKEKISSELLENLNPIQSNVVKHKEGPLLIVAGAGSGKTRVITHRIAYLVRIHDIAPWNIAAVTFTNKAAQEMRARLQYLLGPMAQSVFVRTFHSLGLYIISRHPELAGLKSGFSVIDQTGQQNLIKSILKEEGLYQNFMEPLSVTSQINKARDGMLSPKGLRNSDRAYSEEISHVYAIYIRRLRKNNSVDFADLLYETVRFFEKNAEVRKHYQRLWRYFMIDEYQDTNHVQYLLGRFIAEEHKNIMVVGDDDQSIYSWRGADIQNILNFEKDYPTAKIRKLEENYRSSSPILKVASSLIAHNKERRPKTLFSSRPSNQQAVFLHSFQNEAEEAWGTIQNILHYQSQGIPLDEMAIFYRTNAQSRIFERILRERQLPYVIVNDIGFYARKEIKDILAYLNVIINPEDDLSLERIINVPTRGIGKTSLKRLKALALSRNQSLLECLATASEVPEFRAPKKILSLYKLFRSWHKLYKEEDLLPSALVERVIEESLYCKSLTDEISHEAAGRLENIYELLTSLREYENECQTKLANAYIYDGEPLDYDPEKADTLIIKPSLRDFLQRITLDANEEAGKKEASQYLYLMTLHNAKGLEFTCVYLCGLEEGYLPHSLSLEDGTEEEERRLLYVGITRAREYLHLSYARQRGIFGSLQMRQVSSFVDEIDKDVLTYSFNANKIPSSSSSRSNQVKTTKSKKTTPTQIEVYSTGENIFHEKYGKGVILKIEAMPIGQKLSIRFVKDEAVKLFLSQYTPLSKIQ